MEYRQSPSNREAGCEKENSYTLVAVMKKAAGVKDNFLDWRLEAGRYLLAFDCWCEGPLF
jgi:hypothetical protein